MGRYNKQGGFISVCKIDFVGRVIKTTMKNKLKHIYGMGLGLLLSILFFFSCVPKTSSNIGKIPANTNLSSVSNTIDSQNIIDSLTSGYFSQSFLVDAPHSTAEHSIAFYKNRTFDYRIMDERYPAIDIYQGKWVYQNDSIRISIDKKWTAEYNWESMEDSTGQEIGRKPLIERAWSEGSSHYYAFSEDILSYSFNKYRGGTICFPRRYQTRSCLLKTRNSFLHEIKNSTHKE